MKKLKNQIYDLGETVGQLSAFISEDLLLSTRVLLWLAFLGILSAEKAIEVVNERLQDEKRFIESYVETRFKERAIKSVKDRLGWLVEFASKNSVPFDRLASSIIGNFNFDLSKEIMPLKFVVRFYGSDNASKWKNLVGL